MDNYLKEYVRVMNNIALEDDYIKSIFDKVAENIGTSKNETRKQIAVASVAVVAMAACISYFVRLGNKTR